MKTTVIHHSADFDGIFCREIARRFCPEAELIGWDFGDEPLDFTRLHSEHLIILDLPVDQPFGLQFKDGWICHGNEQIQPTPIDRWDSENIIWIDHHKTAIESHPKDIPGYRIDGVAACRLAWQLFSIAALGRNSGRTRPSKEEFVNREVQEPLAVRLAGEYDIWDKRDPNAELFQHGLRSVNLEDKWETLLSPTVAGAEMVEQLLGRGEAVQYAQKQSDAGTVLHRSFEVKWEGLQFLALNTARCNSLTFEAAVKPEHDALLGFYWNGKKWTVSLYGVPHKPELDLSAIAKKHGGGGHKQACGFQAEKLPFGKL